MIQLEMLKAFLLCCQVLEQIEQRGWQSMKWKDDFTMLHWAASHGKKELCMYLLSQQANPMDQDNKAL